GDPGDLSRQRPNLSHGLPSEPVPRHGPRPALWRDELAVLDDGPAVRGDGGVGQEEPLVISGAVRASRLCVVSDAHPYDPRPAARRPPAPVPGAWGGGGAAPRGQAGFPPFVAPADRAPPPGPPPPHGLHEGVVVLGGEPGDAVCRELEAQAPDGPPPELLGW